MKNTITFLKCIMVLCFFTGTMATAQITVVNNNNSGVGSLRQAVLDAQAGETITFGLLTNLTDITVTGSNIVIDKNLTITGNGALFTSISGNDATRVFSITNNAVVTFNNLTVTEGLAADMGGAISVISGTLTLNSCTVSDSEAQGDAAAQGGGGIYCTGTLNLNGCLITDNEASGTSGSGGGILIGAGGTLNAGSDIINNNITVISNNSASRAGGGIEGIAGITATTVMITLTGVTLAENETEANPGNGGALHITGAGNSVITSCIVANNTAAAEGGGLWNGAGTMTITDTQITGNTASGNAADQGGGGIYNLNGGTLSITDSMISGNEADGTLGSGGGILNDVGSILTVQDTEITNNTAVRAGGGVEDNSGTSTLIFNNTNFMANIVTGPPGNGGAFHSTGAGSATFSGGTISDNTAVQGGGLWMGSGTLTLDTVTITENNATGTAATDGGGGIYNVSGTLTIADSFIIGNTATGTSGSGGGIFSAAGSATITDTQISDNSANRAGGGIEVVAGTYTINNANITGNDVDGGAGTANPGNGGGVHISGASVFTITDGVVNENSAAREGGGLWNQTASTMTVTNITMDENIAGGAGTDDGGGAIFNNGGDLNVVASTLSNNEADGTAGRGGAIHINAGTATITRSTISGNEAAGFGGGIYNNAIVNFDACTIAYNMAANGGGIHSEGTGSLKNTLLSNNEAATGNNASGGTTMLTSNGYNFIETDEEGAIEFNETDIEGTTEMPVVAGLLPLSANDGVNFTHAFVCPSPVADRGEASSTFPDQRGMMVFGERRDIGAFEAQEECSELSVKEALVSGKSVIYPNPSVNGIFNLQLHTNIGDGAAVNVYEMSTGKLVKQTTTEGIHMQLDMTAYATGMYIMQITSGKTTENHKIVVGK